MPVYQYRYSVMRFAQVEAKDISDAAIMARKQLAALPESKLHDIVRVDPPLDPAPAAKDAA
jgi:hypothetical protein